MCFTRYIQQLYQCFPVCLYIIQEPCQSCKNFFKKINVEISTFIHLFSEIRFFCIFCEVMHSIFLMFNSIKTRIIASLTLDHLHSPVSDIQKWQASEIMQIIDPAIFHCLPVYKKLQICPAHAIYKGCHIPYFCSFRTTVDWFTPSFTAISLVVSHLSRALWNISFSKASIASLNIMSP